MTTQVIRLSPALAGQLARAADREGMTHEELLVQALRLFLRATKDRSS